MKYYGLTLNLSFTCNGYIDTSGELITKEDIKYASTDFIEIFYNQIYFTGKSSGLQLYYSIINCYDKNKQFIGGVVNPSTNNGATETIKGVFTLPFNTRYIRCVKYYNNMDYNVYPIPLNNDNLTTTTTTTINTLYNMIVNIDSNLKTVDISIVNSSIGNGYMFYETSFVSINSNFKESLDYSMYKNTTILLCYDLDDNAFKIIKHNNQEARYNKLIIFAIYIGNSTIIQCIAYSNNIVIDGNEYNNNKKYIDNRIQQYYQDNYKSVYMKLGFSAFSKFASIGDSLSVGFHTQSDGTQISEDLQHSWGMYVEKTTGAKSYWTGYSGATCRSWLSTSSLTQGPKYCESLGTMPLYVICMGANESGISIGTENDIGSDNPTTLYGYISKVITTLRKISPKSYIVCTGVSRKQNSTTINNVYKAVAKHYTKVYYIDCEQEFNSEPLSSYYYNYHYTATGYNIMAKLFDDKLSELMLNNIEDFKWINEADS